MNNFFEELQKYFEVTPQDKVLEDWAKYDTVENNVGPTVEDFLLSCERYQFQSNFPLDTGYQNFSQDNLTPKFTSGFFLINNFF